MFISHVSEEVSGVQGRRRAGRPHDDRDALEYRTASELFELMARNSNFQTNEGAPLSTKRDLVFLYKNIDIGTNLISDSKEFKRRSPNQRVESIVYEDFDSDSDLSEICSNEDISNMIMINKERIDRLNSSVDNNVFQKFGDMQLNTNMTLELKNNFSEQNMMSRLESSCSDYYDNALAVTLTDYIRSKGMHNCHNMSMDNVIRYVNYTIDQLKRISNGDYLTDKAREKWKEQDHKTLKIGKSDSNKDLLKTMSKAITIPMATTSKKWDAVIQSEVDIRTLSKMLDKKIVVEVSKPLCESLKYFNIYRPQNFVITCKSKIENKLKKNKSSKCSDVELELNRPVASLVVNTITSISIAQKSDVINNVLPLPCKEEKDIIFDNPTEEKVTIVKKMQFDGDTLMTDEYLIPHNDSSNEDKSNEEKHMYTEMKDNECYSTYERYDNPIITVLPAIADMQAIIQRLNMQVPLPEESNEDSTSPNPTISVPLPGESNDESASLCRPNLNKKRSPTRTRVKSPYENKSRILDEKKRKKLLEIRQKREKTKQALKENSKSKEGQFSRVNSVTKLSISNKSFYDSIYGQPQSTESDQKIKKDYDELENKKFDKEAEGTSVIDDSLTTKSQKFTNRSYFLDEAVTEMMFLDMKHKGDSQPESEVSSRYNRKVLRDMTHFISAGDGASSSRSVEGYDDFVKDEIKSPQITSPDFEDTQEDQHTPTNTPKIMKRTDNKAQCTDDDKDGNPSAEFRKSIDKIYDLINKRAKTEGFETRCKSKFTAVAERTPYTSIDDNSFHGSDSGTSLKHCLSSSNPSYFSFDKGNEKNNELKVKIKSKYQKNKMLNGLPKVILSTRSQAQKTDEKKKDRSIASPKSANANPLKAISQLLHEFDDVQKARKNSSEKQPKKPEVSFADSKGGNTRKSARTDYNNSPESSIPPVKGGSGARPWARSPHSLPSPDPAAKPANRVVRKKVTDMFDEMREARGEAVRGPSFKLNARLNSLAQPKRTYVQAQIEDFQTRYGKSVITDRLQRLNATSKSESQSKPHSPRKKKGHSPINRLSPRSPPTVSPRSPSTVSPPRSPVADKSQKSVATSNRGTAVTVNLQKLTMPLIDSTTKESPIRISTTTTAMTSSSKSNAEKISRVPLLPIDIEIVSDSLTSSSKADDSSTIGNKIHQLIDIVVTRPFTRETSPCVSSHKIFSRDLTSVDPSHKQEKRGNENKRNNQSYFSTDVSVSTGSGDLPIRSLLQTVTEVESSKETNENNDEENVIKADNSMIELEKIEKALYHQISVGNVSKRLRRKNLTLTQKEPVKPLILLQSSGAEYLSLNPPISDRNLIEKQASRKTMNELGTLSWPLAEFPVQIATVGYAFPKYNKNVQHLASELRIGRSNTENSMQCYKTADVERVPVPPYALELVTQLLHIGSSVMYKDKEQVLENIEEEEDKVSASQSEKFSQVDNNEFCTAYSDSVKIIPPVIAKVSSMNVNSFTQCHESDNYNTHKCTPAKEQKSQQHLQTTTENNTEPSHTCKIDSLDVLVGLLNEIQKITSTQSSITFPEVEDIESVLKSAPTLDNLQKEVQNIISITSLEKLRQLESNGSSIYSFCLSDNTSIDNDNCTEKVINSHFMDFTPRCASKEVEKGVQVRELVHKSTDVPSRLLPSLHNHGTYVTNSLIGVLSEPSSESTIGFNEYHLKRRRSFTCLRNVLKLPKIPQISRQPSNCKKNIKEVAVGTAPIEPKPITVIVHEKLNKEKNSKLITLKELNTNMIKSKDKGIAACKKNQVIDQIKNPNIVMKHNNFNAGTHLDPAVNFKRDILVTVYSVLVFTVFAALSIPDILYRL